MRELRVVLVGQEAAGDRALHRIIDAGHCVVAVFTDPTKEPSGTSKLAISAARRGVEQCEGALVRQPQLAGWLREQAIDLLFNVHSLHLVTAEVVDAPTIGSFNLHPGPLPGYPGLNAPSWAVYERRDTFGCTVHWLNDTIDAGCIAYETSFAVGERDNGLTLTARCVSEGLQLLARLLDDAATDPNRIPRREQAGNRVERGPGPPHDGWIRWTEPAASVAALCRASDYGPFPSPWGCPRTVLAGAELHVVRAEVVGGVRDPAQVPGRILAVDDAGLVVAAGGATIVRVTRVERGGEIIPPTTLAKPGERFSG